MKKYSLVKHTYDGELVSMNNISCEELLEELFDFSDIATWLYVLLDNTPSDQSLLHVYDDYIATPVSGEETINNWIVLSTKEGEIYEDFPDEQEIIKFMRNLFNEL